MSHLTSFKLNGQYSAVTSDSRKVKPGGLFLAYPGEHNDGRRYINQAIRAGAGAVCWEESGFSWDSQLNVVNQPIQNLRLKAGMIASEVYGEPSKKLRVVGVTGTNGKTSVSHWLAQCLTSVSCKTAVIGTIGNGFLGEQSDAVNTTPDACLLQEMLATYAQNEARVVVMEVSSHGLDQGRVSGVNFDVAVLTNLSRDHLDYHQTIEAYAAAKAKLFALDTMRIAVLNADDQFGCALVEQLKRANKQSLTYGFNDADVYCKSLNLHNDGLTMDVVTPQGDVQVNASVLGRFNAYNVLAVLTALLALNVSLHAAVAAIADIKSVSGRMQKFGGGDLPLVVVDYAHTPDALENVLITLREQAQARLVCVFGCGGDRDKGKRKLMGEVVQRLADVAYVTTDNPRTEKPESIVEEIVAGMAQLPIVQLDRATAIKLAITNAKVNDIVLIAGKGHEEYQDVNGVKSYFSDAEQVKMALEACA